MISSVTGVAYATQITAAANRHGLDPRLLAAVAAQETGGPGSDSGRNVVGDGGHGHGVFQIDDRYHAFASSASAMNPAANAEYAAGMLSGLLRRYGGDARKALSAYNSGSPEGTGTTTLWPDGSRLGYADSVMRHYASISGEQNKGAPMSNILGHLVHGVESGLTALAFTGNPILAAGAGVLGAVGPDGSAPSSPAGAPSPAFGNPLLEMMNAENPGERQNVNALSTFANGQSDPYSELVNA